MRYSILILLPLALASPLTPARGLFDEVGGLVGGVVKVVNQVSEEALTCLTGMQMFHSSVRMTMINEVEGVCRSNDDCSGCPGMKNFCRSTEVKDDRLSVSYYEANTCQVKSTRTDGW